MIEPLTLTPAEAIITVAIVAAVFAIGVLLAQPTIARIQHLDFDGVIPNHPNCRCVVEQRIIKREQS